MVRAFVGSFLALAGVACGITLLYLGMRSVMEIGGACAEGGPYEISTPCPDGVPLLMVGGIFAGLICLALFVVFVSRLGGSYGTIAAYAWPALFLSLGWNFFEYGVDPPGGDDGLVWGWLICGVVFALMGGLPLLLLLRPSVLRSTWWPPDPDPFAAARPAPIGVPLGGSLTLGDPPAAPAAPGPSTAAAPPTATAPDGDVVARLERLAALRDRGAIDAAEYERAKKAVLGE